MIDRRLFLLSTLALAGCGARPTAAPTLAAAPRNLSVNAPRFGDSNPTDWQGPRPENYPVHGIDISRYQSGIDWSAARDAGVSFAFLKATEGGDTVDPRLTEHWNAAASGGVAVGAYHFFYHCRSAAEQAAWYIQNVPRRPGALPPVLDMEWTPFSPTCTVRPPATQVRAEIQVFLDALHAWYGTRPIVYTTIEFYRDMGLLDVTDTDLWLRATARDPTDLYGRSDWRFWQYSGTGRVPGIPGDVDLNAFNGSAAAWRQWVAARRQPG